MSAVITNTNFQILFITLLVLLLFSQVALLIKISKYLSSISKNVRSLDNFYKDLPVDDTEEESSEVIPRICQYCKYRLVFIHSNDLEPNSEGFYYKCSLRNVRVSLFNSCEKFELDHIYLE